MRRKKTLGLAFSDQLIEGNFKSAIGSNVEKETSDFLLPNFQPEELNDMPSPWKVVIVAICSLLLFFGLFLRLFHLQVIYGSYNKELADSNRIALRTIHAPRGVIYDRNGKVVAESNPGWRIKDKFLTRDEALSLEARNDPDFYKLEIDAIRHYPLGGVTAHIIGYVSQISEDELNTETYGSLKTGDRVGRSGVEQVYEQVLRGVDGAEIIEVDAGGKKLRTIRQTDPQPGKSLHLSIDADLQKELYRSLETQIKKVKACCGTAIASSPQTGEILAMVSFPSFDANVFTDPTKNSQVTDYFQNPNSPLLNRAISGTYPPGSTFKITSALAGLTSGKIDKSTLIEDTGIIFLGPFSFTNWYFTQYGRKEGQVDIVKALQRSNDIYFYRLGEIIGEKALIDAAYKLGMGKKLGIDLPGEASGLLPSDSWKRENVGEGWYPGDTLHLSIGQGFLLTTPLQILAQTQYIASDGVLFKPYLVKKITDSGGEVVKEFLPVSSGRNSYSKENLELVKAGLEAVPKIGGTAWPFFNFIIPTAGKTGTAEFGDSQDRTHAWYTAYGPIKDPKVVATVLIEAGGEGSSVASPVVKDIFTWYFSEDKAKVEILETGEVTSDQKELGE
ncbi:MAG: penicillin-binding protein 2 [Candidatus Daviesbacteria bacterium]|nr:penicillin-binding protein 2 [Candidatus Daviesbacteria bacterium]